MVSHNVIRKIAASLLGAALCLTIPVLGMADEEGTGFNPDGDRVAGMNAIYGWADARDEHPDFVEDNGPFANNPLPCNACHQIDLVGYANGAPGCVTCHEPEFCGTPGTGDLAICKGGDPFISPGTSLHAGFVPQIRFWSEQHQDVVEDMGVEQCDGCHELNSGGKVSPDTFAAPGCLSCHGPEWLDDDDDDDDDDKDNDHSS